MWQNHGINVHVNALIMDAAVVLSSCNSATSINTLRFKLTTELSHLTYLFYHLIYNQDQYSELFQSIPVRGKHFWFAVWESLWQNKRWADSSFLAASVRVMKSIFVSDKTAEKWMKEEEAQNANAQQWANSYYFKVLNFFHTHTHTQLSVQTHIYTLLW